MTTADTTASRRREPRRSFNRRRTPEASVRRLEKLVKSREEALARARRPAYRRERARLLKNAQGMLRIARERLAASQGSEGGA